MPGSSAVPANPDGSVPVSVSGPATPFGALLVGDLHPEVQRKWVSGLNGLLDDPVGRAGGSVSATTGGELALQTSATPASIAQYRSRNLIPYRSGQGVVARFTARFTAGVADTHQIAGIGDPEDGVFVGFNGDTFGLLRRSGGQVEIHTLTVTAPASGAGDVTITLNGGAVVVTLDGDETECEVAGKIAAADFSGAGGGWRAVLNGDDVTFLAIGTESREGAYSYVDTGGTGATATLVQSVEAVAASDDWIPQTAWNRDRADGSGVLPVLDPTKGNVFQVTYQWLGYGAICLWIENPSNGRLTLAHLIEYANNNTAPSLRQPDLPLFAEVDNGVTTADLTLSSASMGGFKVGDPVRRLGARFSESNEKSTGTTRVNLIAFRVKPVFNGRSNRVRAFVDGFTQGNNSGNRTATVELWINPTLVGDPAWTDVDADSIMEIDTDTTDIVGGTGQRRFTTLVGAASGSARALSSEQTIVLNPGDVVVISSGLASGGGSAAQLGGMTWLEDV